jgi:glycosyltransferase involved in cell wall biosynthesis
MTTTGVWTPTQVTTTAASGLDPAVSVPSLSVVVPVYNSAGSLGPVLAELATTLPTLAERYEVVLVDDGSRDQSWRVIEELTTQYPWAHGIRLMRNYGQHNALLCGIRVARYDVTVTLDDDGQHPPAEIANLLRALKQGNDVVYGTPLHEQHGVLRDLASQLTKLALQSAMGAQTARSVSAFRVFRTELREAFRLYQGPFPSIDVMLTWGTTRFAAVKVQHRARQIGASNYTLTRLITHAVNMMTGFSVLPLQLASLVGFGFTVFGLMVLAYVIGRYLLQGGSVPGFPFLASVIAIFSGAQLFALGIIGEYLARIHFRMMERPTYAVRAHARMGEGHDDGGTP